MGGAFPDPRRVPVSNPRGETGILPGFDRSFLSDPVQPQAGQPGFQPTTMDDLLALEADPVIRENLLREFNFWALTNGLPADTSSLELTTAFMQARAGEEPAGPGAVGRTQFESERALDVATAQLRDQQAQTEAFVRENQRQQAQSTAMERVTSMFDLLQTTDQLADARRQNAVQALISAAPFMVDPSQQFSPGFEPGGVGEILGGLLGANVPNQILPTAELPLQELANPQLAAPPSAITEALNPMLAAPGQPQIPL